MAPMVEHTAQVSKEWRSSWTAIKCQSWLTLASNSFGLEMTRALEELELFWKKNGGRMCLK